MDRLHKQADETHVQRDLRRSMTYNRGTGMARHPELARCLKIDIQFCDPHAPPPTWIEREFRRTAGKPSAGKHLPKPWPLKSRHSGQSSHSNLESRKAP